MGQKKNCPFHKYPPASTLETSLANISAPLPQKMFCYAHYIKLVLQIQIEHKNKQHLLTFNI